MPIDVIPVRRPRSVCPEGALNNPQPARMRIRLLASRRKNRGQSLCNDQVNNGTSDRFPRAMQRNVRGRSGGLRRSPSQYGQLLPRVSWPVRAPNKPGAQTRILQFFKPIRFGIGGVARLTPVRSCSCRRRRGGSTTHLEDHQMLCRVRRRCQGRLQPGHRCSHRLHSGTWS